MNDERLWGWGGWHGILTGRGTGSVSFRSLHGITDLRPRLSRPDQVVHQTRREPHTDWVSLISRLLYCPSHSVWPATCSFYLSAVDSDTHITCAVQRLAVWLCSQKWCYCSCHTGHLLSAETPDSPVGGEQDSNWWLSFTEGLSIFRFLKILHAEVFLLSPFVIFLGRASALESA